MNLGCSYFFNLLSLMFFLFCSYIFALSLHWATAFVKMLFISCWNYALPWRLFISWYLLIAVHFCFPNLDKMFFVLISALIVLILFFFSSKSHCSFKIVLIKNSELSFVCYLSSISVCFFLVPILWPVFTRLFRKITAYIKNKN